MVKDIDKWIIIDCGKILNRGVLGVFIYNKCNWLRLK